MMSLRSMIAAVVPCLVMVALTTTTDGFDPVLDALKSEVNSAEKDAAPSKMDTDPSGAPPQGQPEEAAHEVVEPRRRTFDETDQSPNPAATSSLNAPDFGSFLQSNGPEDRLESSDLLLVETKDGLAAYSLSLGKWDTVIVGKPKDGLSRLRKATLSSTFACVMIEDQLLGFSSKVGRWSKLPIPPEAVGKVAPVVGNMLSVKIGDRIYALSPKTGEWTSPELGQAPIGVSSVDHAETSDAEQKLRLAVDSPETRRVLDEIAKYESRSTRQAEQIRQMLKAKPFGAPESTSILEARRELESTLARALELKTQVEQWRVRDMQARLSRMEQQIDQRKAQAAQIIKRRAFELIEGEETDWGGRSPVTPSLPSGRSSGSFNQETSATNLRGRIRAGMEVDRTAALGLSEISRKDEPLKTPVPDSKNKKPNEFFVMNADGTDLRSLYRFEDHPHVGSPAVSPDGQWIAFDQVTVGNSEKSYVYVMGINGGNLRRVCSGLMPTWFSDDRYLLCTRREPTYGLWKVDRESDEHTYIRPGLGGQVSPDGTRIAINYNPDLAVFDLKTARNRTIIGGRSNPFVHVVSNGTWSPDGKSFCFVGIRSSGVRDICTTTMSGTNDLVNLKTHHSFRDNVMTDFAWHPNGDRVIFSGICKERNGLKQLYEFNPKKPGSVELVAGQDATRNNLDMSWTPDGKRLIFISGDYCED